jgi:hypothetical protein
MAHAKGTPKTPGSGRVKGTPNKVNQTAREMFNLAAQGIGGLPALIAWAKKNPSAFWTLYARLIPLEHVGDQGGPIPVTIIHRQID